MSVGARGCTFLVVIIASLYGLVPAANAQQASSARNEVFAGSTLESYIRYLQTTADSSIYPVSVRSFTVNEVGRLMGPDTSHPWAARYFAPPRRMSKLQLLGVTLSEFANTSFPFGGNDGPVWKGRGFTTVLSGGFATSWKALSLTFAPTVFRAENADVALMPNGQEGILQFADGRFPLVVDRPQTFGTSPYARFDLGETTLRLDAGNFAAAISTASQWWGPASEFPVVLGNNAGGYPHFFIGTSHPARLGPFRFHGRVVYGYLEQSRYSSVTGRSYFENFTNTGTRRFTAGVVAVTQLRSLRGFELGGSRFFHAANARSGITGHNLFLPIQGLFKAGLPIEQDSAFGNNRAVKENQLASLFLRIAPPGSGFEVYVEHGREDHSNNLFDYLLEPDHSTLTTTGFRKAWVTSRALTAVRGEVMSYDAPSALRLRPLGQEGAYTHATLRQGHTHRGQLLAADVGPGSGNAQFIAFDKFTTAGRVTAYFRRAVARESIDRYAGDAPVERPLDVLNTIGAELMRFRGAFDITVNASLTLELNRNFVSDKTNAGLGVIVRRGW